VITCTPMRPTMRGNFGGQLRCVGLGFVIAAKTRQLGRHQLRPYG
jgi:hypothetical protein